MVPQVRTRDKENVPRKPMQVDHTLPYQPWPIKHELTAQHQVSHSSHTKRSLQAVNMQPHAFITIIQQLPQQLRMASFEQSYAAGFTVTYCVHEFVYISA